MITSVADDATIEDQGIVTGKVFEAMGMGVPILLIAPHGSDAIEIVEGTSAGRRFSASDIELMSQYILSLARSARKPARGHERYSWPLLADQFNEIVWVPLTSTITPAALISPIVSRTVPSPPAAGTTN